MRLRLTGMARGQGALRRKTCSGTGLLLEMLSVQLGPILPAMVPNVEVCKGVPSTSIFLLGL